ncbi:hypothetical protein P4O66_021784, partial [Electrophorus voltai]
VRAVKTPRASPHAVKRLLVSCAVGVREEDASVRVSVQALAMFLSGLLTLWATTFTLSGHYVAFALQDVSKDLFGSENHGTVAAFGDFNSDKQTDIFILRGQTELLIFLADLKAPYFKPKVHLTKDAFPRDISVITSVVPADYDGDSQMDVLLTGHLKNSDPGQNSVFIFWGNNQTLDQSGRVDLNNTFQDQPLVMDFNGDMVPDIFGVVDGAPEICYLRNRKLRCEKALSSGVTIRVPHSNAFIDLNKDFTAGIDVEVMDCGCPKGKRDVLNRSSCIAGTHVNEAILNSAEFESKKAADLFLSTQSNSGLEFETWINTDGNFTRNHSVGVPEDSSVVGQSAFVDFDGDGSQDHLLPMCLDSVCKKSAIYLAKPGHTEWAPVLLDFQNRDTLWGFVSPPHNPSEGELELPITLHLGDYNLDGFPDALAILCNTSHREQAQAFLLENVPCTNASCRSVGRMFRVHWDQSDLSAIPRAAVATFFDIYEDGILDMIVLSRADGQQDFKIHALKNNFEADAYFVKVIVLGIQTTYPILPMGLEDNIPVLLKDNIPVLLKTYLYLLKDISVLLKDGVSVLLKDGVSVLLKDNTLYLLKDNIPVLLKDNIPVLLKDVLSGICSNDCPEKVKDFSSFYRSTVRTFRPSIALPSGLFVLLSLYRQDFSSFYRSTVTTFHPSIALPSGLLILLSLYRQDFSSFYRSTVRTSHPSIALPSGLFILLSLYRQDFSSFYRSTVRTFHPSIALPSGLLILLSLYRQDFSSFYRSTVRTSHLSIALPSGLFILLSLYRQDFSSFYRSTVRTFHPSIALPSGLLILLSLYRQDFSSFYRSTPFGVNQPGPYVMYMSVDSNGYLKNASAGQLSQSAHLSLQLPYTVLGLGRSANFLDHLFVGIPRPLGVKDMRKQEWTAIIPNSQLIVIPYPNSDPRSWSAKLYLTPSNIVLLTAVALIGVCLFILVIIGVLHWQEKKADDREKRQEAHRFHFDAM